MPKITSSMMTYARYDAKRRTMTITFTSGERYDYFDVPGEVYEQLLTAESAGRYFDACIRDRYRYQRLWR